MKKLQIYSFFILPFRFSKEIANCFGKENNQKDFVSFLLFNTALLLNKSLMKKESFFDIYVKAMYEGLYIGSLKHSNNEILYPFSTQYSFILSTIKNFLESSTFTLISGVEK